MSNNEVLDYLNQKNIMYKIIGKEAMITCPECGKEKLSINIDTCVYRCFVCGAENPSSPMVKGHLSNLKSYFGDSINVSKSTSSLSHIKINTKPSEKAIIQKEPDYTNIVRKCTKHLLKDAKQLRYLEKRGINKDSILKYGLGVITKNEQNWLVIPSHENSTPKLLKYRKLSPDINPKMPKYMREKDGKSILFNQDCIKDHDTLIICEGELDAITLLQNGYPNVIGITGGAGTLKPEWYELLYLKSKLYLCFDPDSAGQNAAKDVWATRLGMNKCFNIILPVNEEEEAKSQDVNNFFLKHTKQEFDELIEGAKKFEIKGVCSLSDALLELYEHSKEDSTHKIYSLPWANVNKLIGGGHEKQKVLTLSGIPGVGKTTFAIQMAYHMASFHKIPSFVFCMEMPEYALATKVVQQHFLYTYQQIKPAEALIYNYEIGNLPLYFGYQPKITPDIFFNTVKECRDRYGVEFVVFDNIHRMIRSENLSDMGNASAMFKDMAMSLKIMVTVLAQPRKATKMNERPTQESMKGDSSLIEDADIIMALYRKRVQQEGEDSLSPLVEVLVDKSRLAGGGMTKLSYDGARATFSTLD